MAHDVERVSRSEKAWRCRVACLASKRRLRIQKCGVVEFSEREGYWEGMRLSNRIISPVKLQDVSWSTLSGSFFLRESVLFATSSMLYQGSRFLVNLGVARILGPTTYGFWNMLNLILAYSNVIHIGVINAMNRDVPLFKGKGDLQKVGVIRHVSLGFMSVSILVAGALMVIIALLIENPILRTSLKFMALLLLCSKIYAYLQVYLKSDRRFNQVSCQQFVSACLFPAAVIPLAMVYGLPGFILGQSVAILAVSLLTASIFPFDLRLKFNAQEVVRLIKVGFPIMAVGLLHGLLITVDRWVITGFLGAEQLGYYSLSIMVMGFLALVPMLISEQIYPRMAEVFGRTSSYVALRKWIFLQAIISLGVTVPMVTGVYCVFPVIVQRFLPAYVPGIAAMKIILIGLLFLPLIGGFGNFLNTVGKQIYYMGVQGFAVLANVGFNVAFVKAGMGISGVALGTTLSYAIYNMALFMIGISLLRRELNHT